MLAGVGAVGRVGRHGIRGGAKRPSFSVDFVNGGGSLGAGAVFTRASTGTYYDSAGVLRSAAIDVPRFDYDPATLQLNGLLLEDASTNIALWSSDYSNAVWNKGAITVAAPVVTVNNATAPDGTTTAARIDYPAVTGAGAVSVVQQFVPVTAIPYTFSVWLRGAVGGERLYLNMNNPTYYKLSITLTTQWQRFTLTTPALTAASWWAAIGTDLRDGTQTSTPAQTIYAWGAQVEALPYMSSHIPTTSVSVTRAQDVLYYPIPSAVPGYNQSNGTMFFEYILSRTNEGGFAGMSDLTYGNAMYLSDDVAGNVAYSVPVSGGGSANSNAPASINAIRKSAATYSATSMKLCNDGASVGSTVIAITPPAQTRLTLGNDPWSFTTSFNSWARRISYWPRTLSDSEMQAVTTLAGPTLSLDFMQPGTLDPRITFTRASTATYTDASGVIQTAAVNQPRWDYANGVLRGLLIEEQRTNIALQSGDLANAAWVKVGSSTPPAVTANQTTAPDGTLTAARVVLPAVPAGNYSVIYQGAFPSGSYVASIWLKGSVGGEQFYIGLTDNGANRARVRVTLTTAWQRFSLVAGFTAPVNVVFGCDQNDPGQSPTLAATFYAWGAQVEQGAFPTSYIPTTSVSVTRAIDMCQIPTNVSWYNGVTFSQSIEFVSPPGNTMFTGFSDATFGNSCYVGNDATPTMSATYVPATGGTAFGGAMTRGAVTKLAYSVTMTRLACCSNGGAISAGTMTAATPLTVATRLSIGNDPWSLSISFNSHVRRINVWNRALSDTELQSVTT